jgi:hypothetical protein
MSFAGTTGRSYPRRKADKRRRKDAANRWQKELNGRGPEKTIKG